jgi:hypothetical protein
MSTVKTYKKGEILLREGDKTQTVLFIQTGSVALQLQRQKVTVDLCTLGSSQVVGEHALSGVASHPYTAIALAETKAIELPVEGVRSQIESAPQLMKLLAKALSDKMKVVMTELKSIKLERDNTPCPADQTAKIFATVFHTARSKGEVRDGVVKVSWPLMKQYAQRMFLESPKRFENAVNIFVKLQAAKYEMVKNDEDPEAPEEIGYVYFNDLDLVEHFFEFFQYYHFKGGKSDLLKTDERVMAMVQVFLELAASEQRDRFGAVRLDYAKVVDKIKEKLGIALNADHFAVIEQKGLLVKRQSNDKGVVLQFDHQEFDRTWRAWRVLREVERWNEKGFVDPYEPQIETRKNAKAGPECPSCHHALDGAPKFCPECGTKIAAAA